MIKSKFLSLIIKLLFDSSGVRQGLIIKRGNREKRKYKDTVTLPGTLLFYHQDELHRNLHTSHPSKNINLEINPQNEESIKALKAITQQP